MRAAAALAVALVALAALAARGGPAQVPTPVADALTAIDYAPTRAQLEAVLGQPALPPLAALALGQPGLDPGVRLRAIRGLARFDDPAARAALRAILDQERAATAGAALLHRRAAAEALGALRDPADVATLAPLLEVEASRDLRAAAARALGELGAPAAAQPLRDRYLREPAAQVRRAIEDALAALGLALR